MPTDDPRFAGLTNMGNGSRAQISSDVGLAARGDHVVHHRQHPFLADTFHHLLVHGDGRRHHARADIRQVRQLEQALHRAVLAEGPVQHGEDDVDFRLRARLGQDRLGQPLALLIDKVFDPLVFRGIQRVHDGARRTHRHLMLAAAAAIDDGNS